MLTSLRIRNFKSWADTGEMRLAPITGLFGANSSGKTSILQFLLLLKQTVESPDQGQPLNFGGEPRWPADLGGIREVLHHRSAATELDHPARSGIDAQALTSNSSTNGTTSGDVLSWSIDWSLNQPHRVIDPQLSTNVALFTLNELRFVAKVRNVGTVDRPQPVIDCLDYVVTLRSPPYIDSHHLRFGMLRDGKRTDHYSLQSPPEFTLRRFRGRAWPLPPPLKCYGFPPQVFAYYQNADFLRDFPLLFEDLFGYMYYLGPLREEPQRQYRWGGGQPSDMGRRGEQVVGALLASRERGEYLPRGRGRRRLSLEGMVAFWLKQLGMVSDFSVSRIAEGSDLYRVFVRKEPGGPPVPVTDVGFGVSQILPVITLCYYVPEGSTIILEQPEIHLHPAVQAGLADVLIDAVKTRGVQILLESHSEHLLARLQRRIAEESIPASDVAFYFCAMADGASSLTTLQLDDYGNITNWPQGFFGDEMGDRFAMAKAGLERRMAQAGA